MNEGDKHYCFFRQDKVIKKEGGGVAVFQFSICMMYWLTLAAIQDTTVI
jgi:hypothetical protein